MTNGLKPSKYFHQMFLYPEKYVRVKMGPVYIYCFVKVVR